MKRRKPGPSSSWPEPRGDPYHYLMIPHDEVRGCAPYIQARELRLNSKRPEWKLFWTEERAWFHNAVGVRLVPSELSELVRLAELSKCLEPVHIDALRALGTLAAEAQAEPLHSTSNPPRSGVELAPLRAACAALLEVVANPPHFLHKEFRRAIVKRYDLVGHTACVSPFGWLAAAVEDLQLHAACWPVGYHVYFEIMLG